MSTHRDSHTLFELGARLKEERERLGMNQTDFAAQGGVSKVTQFNYESGRRSPDALYLAAVGSLGVDVLYIVTGQRASEAVGLAPDEVALVDDYRHSTEDRRNSLKEMGAALARISKEEGHGEGGA